MPEARRISPGGDNPSMALADTQKQRLLELLREAGEEPVAFGELHAGGVSFPAAVVSELGLNGYPTERVHDHGRLVGVRLLDSEPLEHPPHADGAEDRGRTDSQPCSWRLASGERGGSSDLRLASVSVVPLAAGAWGGARPAERRSRACRCSRGHRPSGSDSEARDRHGALPQPHPSGVDGRLTQTPPRHVCRLQRPCSLPT